jgi:hypothetical protein
MEDKMSVELEVDYLVVGAGAAGMAFADQLLTHSGATVAIVDRRHAPGGHWIDAYPYVRLHQPSVFYGVDSEPLGGDTIDTQGTNAGYYELAGADELRAYYAHVMRAKFLPGGRVHYFPNSEYVGEHRFVSRLTGEASQLRVRRKVVDTTYLEGEFPASSPPPFEVADGVRCVPAGEIARLADFAEKYVVIGAGKTALDACVWLLERGVPPSSIRWIKPRESWWLNRRFQQPRKLLPELYRGMAVQFEAMAQAASLDELLARLEAEGILLRIDPGIRPTMFRGAIIGEAELGLLRKIEDVVHLGHVMRIERDAIVLEGGRVPTRPSYVHVHCAARGLARPPLRPIFEAARVTPQPFMWSFACFQFALLGVAEATIVSDEEKNRLFPPIQHWDRDTDYLSAFLATLANSHGRAAYPAIADWAKRTRLNALGEIGLYRDDPVVKDAQERVGRFAGAVAQNLVKLRRASAASGQPG